MPFGDRSDISQQPAAQFGVDDHGIERHEAERDRHREHRGPLGAMLLSDQLDHAFELLVEVAPLVTRQRRPQMHHPAEQRRLYLLRVDLLHKGVGR
jgi:hypothetical protein